MKNHVYHVWAILFVIVCMGSAEALCNAQVQTTATVAPAQSAKPSTFVPILSHRSGATNQPNRNEEADLAFEARQHQYMDLCKEAHRLNQGGKAQEAIELFEQANNLDANHSNEWVGELMNIYQKQGRQSDVVRVYEKAYEPSLRPFFELHMEYALLLLRSNRAEEALMVYHKAITLDNQAHYVLPLRKRFDNSVAFSPSRLEGAIETALGMEQYNSSHYDEAVLHLQRATRLSPALANAHFYLGLSLLQSHDQSQKLVAKAELERATYLGATEVKPVIEKLKARGRLSLP